MQKKVKKGLIVIFALLLTGAACFFTGSRWQNQRSVPVISNDILEEKLKTINELSTVSYQYTNMGKFEDQTNFYGWNVPLTKKSFIVSYDGTIKAGVDMSKATVTTKDDKITITLPKAEIFSHEIKDDSIQVFDETKNIFNPISLTDYTGFSASQKNRMTEKSISSGILETAENNAQKAVLELLNFNNTEEIEFIIKFSEP